MSSDHVLLLHHHPQLRPLTPPHTVQININDFHPVLLFTLGGSFARPCNPREIESDVDPSKSLHSLQHSAIHCFLIANIKLHRFNLHVRILSFDFFGGCEQILTAEIRQGQISYAILCQIEGRCPSQSYAMSADLDGEWLSERGEQLARSSPRQVRCSFQECACHCK